ncbi:SWIRM domain-containing protein [Aspergillus mulundensis]|uniref:SWIRM domain-containing protein n=1 Tax=Aspergillus mulundensis TaxID=1810919 RepID=A0A3D8R5D8_9EURO|nr:hypothetical protein DSM5745_08948 [Aspergillus mulundensis]RDW69188.1 hypothetical protein DSM5745_08948 [Aspergillus mulundensis]
MGRIPPVSSLMSPPESKPFESFNSSFPPHRVSQDQLLSHEMHLAPISGNRKRTQSEMDLPSPPVTPYTGNHKKSKSIDPEQPEGDALAVSRDPVLFSAHESLPELASYEPLIGPMPPPSPEAVMEHIESHMARFDNKLNKPTRAEYFLALSCVPVVCAQYNRNPAAWAKEERNILERQLVMMNRHRPDVSEDGRLKRIAPAPTKRVVPAQTRVQRTPRVKRTPKPTPKQKALDTFEVYTPNSKPSRAIGTSRDDTDYSSIQDYSPSLEVLGSNAKALKADWKGQMLDLSNDPERELLIPAEINLAATLRLSCATYLCSKRRIFEARVKALRVGKEFRKTDAQQACKIDVNKASKLWTAYERVGLFNPAYFHQYLD